MRPEDQLKHSLKLAITLAGVVALLASAVPAQAGSQVGLSYSGCWGGAATGYGQTTQFPSSLTGITVLTYDAETCHYRGVQLAYNMGSGWVFTSWDNALDRNAAVGVSGTAISAVSTHRLGLFEWGVPPPYDQDVSYP